MRIDILTLFPELFKGVFDTSILKKATKKNLVQIFFHNIRDYSKKKNKQSDDYPYGGGPGMVLMIQPIYDCIKKLKKDRNYDEIIFFTPDAEKFNQKTANKYSLKKNLIIICGHYKGIDERIRKKIVSKEISIGDYVLTGGELPAAVFCDALIRLIPGVLGNESSALSDSFQDDLISPPLYTRPRSFNGWKIPEILISGDKNKIDNWKEKKSIKRTKKFKKL